MTIQVVKTAAKTFVTTNKPFYNPYVGKGAKRLNCIGEQAERGAIDYMNALKIYDPGLMAGLNERFNNITRFFIPSCRV